MDCWADFAEYFNKEYLLGNDREEAIKALVENIKHHKNEWEIKEMNWNKDGEYYYDMPEREKKINKQTILLHQSAQIEYSKNGFLIIRPPKMYRKDYFPSEQWTEIKKVLNQEPQTTKNRPAGKQILIICGVIFLTIGMIILLIYLIRKWKQK